MKAACLVSVSQQFIYRFADTLTSIALAHGTVKSCPWQLDITKIMSIYVIVGLNYLFYF